LVCLEGARLHALPLEELPDPATGRTRVRFVDIQSEHYKVARDYMIRLERRDLEDPDMRAKLVKAANMRPEEFDSAFSAGKVNAQQVPAWGGGVDDRETISGEVAPTLFA
jgi:6-phosphofructokinase 1